MKRIKLKPNEIRALRESPKLFTRHGITGFKNGEFSKRLTLKILRSGFYYEDKIRFVEGRNSDPDALMFSEKAFMQTVMVAYSVLRPKKI